MSTESVATNPKLAELAAKDAGLVDEGGAIQWDALRREYPFLFRPPAPQGNAGTGTAAGAPTVGGSPSKVMNQWIRNQAVKKG